MFFLYCKLSCSSLLIFFRAKSLSFCPFSFLLFSLVKDLNVCLSCIGEVTLWKKLIFRLRKLFELHLWSNCLKSLIFRLKKTVWVAFVKCNCLKKLIFRLKKLFELHLWPSWLGKKLIFRLIIHYLSGDIGLSAVDNTGCRYTQFLWIPCTLDGIGRHCTRFLGDIILRIILGTCSFSFS